jgi:hypothetical protein
MTLPSNIDNPIPPGLAMEIDRRYPGNDTLATEMFFAHRDLLRLWMTPEILKYATEGARENTIGTWHSITNDARTTYRTMAYVVWRDGYHT